MWVGCGQDKIVAFSPYTFKVFCKFFLLLRREGGENWKTSNKVNIESRWASICLMQLSHFVFYIYLLSNCIILRNWICYKYLCNALHVKYTLAIFQLHDPASLQQTDKLSAESLGLPTARSSNVPDTWFTLLPDSLSLSSDSGQPLSSAMSQTLTSHTYLNKKPLVFPGAWGVWRPLSLNFPFQWFTVCPLVKVRVTKFIHQRYHPWSVACFVLMNVKRVRRHSVVLGFWYVDWS